MNSLDFEQAEIPESPGAIQGCLAVGVPSQRPSDGDDGRGSAAITAITETVAVYTEEDSSVEEQQNQVKAQQEREETIGDGGRFPPSRQPEAPISTSTVRVLESGLVSVRQSLEVAQGQYARTQTTSPIMSPAREVACMESRSCISLQDITFLRVKG